MPNPSIFDTQPDALRRPTIFDNTPATQPTPAADAPQGELGRGLDSAFTSSVSAAHAAVGAALDFVGLRDMAAGQYQSAREGAQQAAATAPFTDSLRDIHGLADVPKYIAAKSGEGAALLGPALLSAGAGAALGIPGVIGAALPMLPIGAGESIMPHIQQNNTLDQPAGDLLPKALARGAVEAGLMGVAPGVAGEALAGRAAVGSFTGGLARATARDAAIQGVTAPAAVAAGNAIEGKPTSGQELLDAAAGGALGMAPLSAAAHAVGGVPIKLPDRKPSTEPAPATPQADAAPAVEPASPKDAPTDWASKVAGGAEPFAAADATDHGRAAQAFQDGLSAPASSLDELRARRTELNDLGTKYAGMASNDDRLSDEQRAYFTGVAQDGATPADYSRLGGYADALNQSAKDNEPSTQDNLAGATQAVKDIGKQVNDAVKTAREKAGDDDSVKFSSMDTGERSDLRDYVFSHLKPEYKDDPDALGAARSATHTLARLSTLGDDPSSRQLGRSLYHVLDDLVADKAEFIKGLPSELKDVFKDQPERITADANVGGSAFDAYINKDLTNGQRAQVATRLEQYIRGEVPDQYDQPVRQALADQLGGEAKLRALIEHYGDRYEGSAKRSEGNQKLDPNGEHGDSISEQEEPASDYTFAEPGTSRGFTSKQSAYEALDNLRTQDPQFSKNYSVVSMAKAAEDLGGVDKVHADTLDDLTKRAAADAAHADEQVPGTSFTRGDRAKALQATIDSAGSMSKNDFLDRYHVIKSADRDPSSLVATGRDLQNMRQSLDRGIRTPDANFQVEFTNGKRLTVNAESVWKTMVKKGLQAQQDEGDHQYRSRMFKEGVASILARPDVKAVHGADRADLMIDRELGIKYRNLSGSVEHGKAIAEHAQKFEKLDAKFEEWTDKLQDQFTNVKAKGEARQEMADMRSRQEKILNGQHDPIRQAIAREVLERLDRTEARLKEDSLIASGLFDKRDGSTDLVKEMEDQTRRDDASGKNQRNPDTEHGSTGMTTPDRVDRLNKLAETIKAGKIDKVIARAEKSRDLNGMQETRTHLIEAARSATGEAKKNLTRVIGALSNRVRDLVGEKFSPQEYDPLRGAASAAERADPKAAAEGVKYSKQRVGDKQSSKEERLKAESEFSRIAGDDIKRVWTNLNGDSGKWDPRKDTVSFSKFAADPTSVAWHEAVHALMSKLLDPASRTKMRGALQHAADSGVVVRQLEKLLKDHPEALEQIRNDPEERLAYMFQFHRAGLLKLGPETKSIFGKIMDFIHKVTGTVSKYERAEKYMDAIYDGKFSDPSVAGLVIHDMKNEVLKERLKRLTGPVGEAADKIWESSVGRLESTQIPALMKLASLYHVTPDKERGNRLGFMQERARMQGKFENRVYEALKGIKAEDGRQLIRELRSGNPPTSARGKAVAGILKDVFKYMQDAGVKRAVTDKDGKVTGWADLTPRQDYGAPQIWNRNAIIKDPNGFVKDMVKAGIDAGDAKAIHDIVMKPKDHDAVNMSNLGFTPFNRSVNSREFHFTPEQLQGIEKYLDNDPVSLMTTYVHQATHRAEHSRTFGFDASKTKQLLAQAEKQGATQDELLMARKAISGMDGTIGADMDPQMRKITAGLVVYENLALLPFALFSSLVDPINAAARSGEWGEARKAMVIGLKGIVNDVRGKEGEDRHMARTLGLISEANMLEKFGDLYNGMYMSKWLKNINEHFFRLNGMESWNKSMRTAAMVAGERFMLKHTQRPEEHSERWMRELGIDKGDIKPQADGRIAKTQEQGLSPDQEERVQRALFKYVDDAVLRPNAAHRPIWGNDPHYNIIFHLKQYSYSYQETFTKRALHEADYGNLMPLWSLAAAVPFMDVVDTAQDLLFGGTVHHAAGGLLRAVARSGMLGTKTFALDAATDPIYGGVPGQSFLGPTINHGIYAAQTAAGQHSAGSLLFRSLPAGGVVHGFAS